MAVRGVRKSCVTESSRMERRLLHGPGAFDGDADQAAYGIQAPGRKLAADDGECAERAQANAQRPDAKVSLGIMHRLATVGDAFQFLGGDQPPRLDCGVVDLLALAVHGKQSGRGGAEDLHYLAGDDIQQLEHIVRGEQLLAKSVELLQFAAMGVGIFGLAPRALGELAGDDCGDQKGEERDPILGIGDGERAVRREEEEVVGKGCEHGEKDRAAQSPTG